MLHQSIIGRVRPILVTIKSSPIYPKVIPKGAIAIFTKSCIVFKIAQKLKNIWAILVTKIVTKNVQKSPRCRDLY